MNRLKVKFRKWLRHYLEKDNPHLQLMRNSNARLEFLLEHLEAAKNQGDTENFNTLQGLIDSESEHFKRLVTNAKWARFRDETLR